MVECSESRILLGQLVHCVKHLHNKGLVHKDIKPTNFFLNFRRRESQGFTQLACYDKELTKCEVRLGNLIYV